MKTRVDQEFPPNSPNSVLANKIKQVFRVFLNYVRKHIKSRFIMDDKLFIPRFFTLGSLYEKTQEARRERLRKQMNSVAWASTADPPNSHADHHSPSDHGADYGLETQAMTLQAQPNPNDGRSLLNSSSVDGRASEPAISAGAAAGRPASAEPMRRAEVTSLLSELNRCDPPQKKHTPNLI
jgi:hypothetical protein